MLKQILTILIIINTSVAFAQKPDKYIWYKQPAEAFEESMVLGNGTQGACVFGGITKEKIYLNDVTLWSGEPVNSKQYEGIYKNLPAVREALAKENYTAAEELAKKLKASSARVTWLWAH